MVTIILFCIILGAFALLAATLGIPWYTDKEFERPRIIFFGIAYFFALLILMLILSSTV